MTPDQMKACLDILGRPVRDKVSGFAGVASSVCFDLYGCIQVAVTPRQESPDKEFRSGGWFDFVRLEPTGADRVMPVPTFPDYGAQAHGPADKAPPRQ